MANIILFDFENHDIRFIGTAENPEWIADDICNALGLGNTSQALSRLKPNERGIISNDTDLLTGSSLLTVNETGLYRLIFGSRKAAAERMKDWVFSVVLPSIRKTGSYLIAAEIPVPKQSMSGQIH